MIVENRVSERLDPIELNRGQPIHFKGSKEGLTNCDSDGYSGFKNQNKNVEEKSPKDLVFLDWFEQTLTAIDMTSLDPLKDRINLSDDLVLVALIGKTSHYLKRWELVYLGESFGTVLSSPSNGYMKPNQLQFKVNNDMLYISDWLDSYKDIIASAKWIPLSNTRIDIAVDGEAGKKAKLLSQRHLKGSVIGRKGKAVMTVGYLPNKSVKGFHVGSPNSEKSATIYNKVDSIAKTDKTYIQKAWDKNNLDSELVDRFEIRMRSKIANNYDWQRLDDSTYLATVVRTECKNWFEFYYKGKDKNKHRVYKNKTMEWIDWDSIRGELLPKHQAVSKSGIYRAKRIIKDSLYMKYVEDKRIDDRLISELKVEYVLTKWYDDRIDNWLAEFNRIKKYRDLNSN